MPGKTRPDGNVEIPATTLANWAMSLSARLRASRLGQAVSARRDDPERVGVGGMQADERLVVRTKVARDGLSENEEQRGRRDAEDDLGADPGSQSRSLA